MAAVRQLGQYERLRLGIDASKTRLTHTLYLMAVRGLALHECTPLHFRLPYSHL